MTLDVVKRKVPIDLLFSRKSLVESSHKYHTELLTWEDIPIINLHPYFTAIRSVRGSDDTLADYLEFRKKISHPETPDTLALVSHLSRKLSQFHRLFRKTLPLVAGIDRDRLILANGNMESCIAKYRGHDWIDVLMPVSIASLWDSRSTNELDAVLEQQKRDAFYTPIMHAKYRKWKISRKGSTRLDLIRQFLGPIRARLSLLDIGCNTGYYTFHFFRQGFDVCGIDIDPLHFAIAEAQRSMYSADIRLELCSVQDFSNPEPFDIVLALSVFWHLLGWGKYDASLTPTELGQILDRLVRYALFWEGGKRGHEEIELIKRHSTLKHYKKLGTTSASGIQNREFGVFTRRPSDEIRASLRHIEPS